MDTLEELEWCLDQLEAIQTHKSVSDMATNKVSIDWLLLRMCLITDRISAAGNAIASVRPSA